MKTSVRVRGVGLALLVLFLSACTESADLFSSLDDPETPSVEMVASGSVISPEDPISIQLSYPDDDMSRATSLIVELHNPDGEVIQELSFSEEQLLEPELPMVQLWEPAPGPYILVVEAYRGEEPLFREERQIFVTPEVPQVRSLSVYPSKIGSDADALAIVDVYSPAETRPYLKWHFQNELIGEGYVDNGAGKIVFSPRDDAGVRRISVDLYPWGPDEGVLVHEETSLNFGTDVFILDQVPQESRDDRFLLYYPLDGRLVPDTDRLTDGFVPLQADGVVLDVYEERLGYRIAPETTVSIPYNLLPAPGETYRILVRFARRSVESRIDISAVYDGTERFGLGMGSFGNVEFRRAEEIIGLATTGESSRVISDTKWETVSLLIAGNEEEYIVIPEIHGVDAQPFSLSRQPGDHGDTAFVLRNGGSESLFVETIAVISLGDLSQLFDREYGTFLYHDSSDTVQPSFRAAGVDLSKSDALLQLPEEKFLLWTVPDGEARYLFTRNGDSLWISVPNGTTDPGRIAQDDIAVTSLASATVPDGFVVIRAGEEFSVDLEQHVVTLPLTDDMTSVVFSGAFNGDPEALVFATVAR